MSAKLPEAPSGGIDNALDDVVVQDILNSFTDLRQYSKEIEKELKEAEDKSIQDYIKESANIASLHNQISACDEILERMESMLVGFQTDLGSISSEILSLQRKSISMSQELSNRQAIRGQLSQFIDDMAVPESLIVGIMENPVTDKEFLTQLQILNHKISFVKEQSFKESKSCLDVKEILEKLKIKAMSKIRTYLLEQVYKFRKPMTNYQVPQNNMLKYKFFFEFILSNERNVAQEICNEYVDTMSKIYFSYFKSYSGRIMKLQYEECTTKDDLMGIEDTATRGLFNKSLKHKGTVFTIGNRGDVLAQQLEAPIIVPHAQSKNRYPFEALFRSEQYALVDNACREYLFVSEFFMVRGQPALDLFNQIMGKTTGLLKKNLETFVSDCYDTIALFLCFHLILRYKIMCHKRCVPALDDYWDNLEKIILTRFEYVFRLNIASIRDCDPTKFNLEMGPHYITRRYAEFSAALVGISENFPNELVNCLLAELQEEVELFILRMAGIFPERKEQLIFLINNYDMILHVIMERTRDNSKEAETFKSRLSSRSGEYVEEILSPHFGELMQYVKECEYLLEKSKTEEVKKMEGKSLAIVQHFSANWKKSLEELNREVLLSFPNLVTGSSLLQLALTQLVQYYHRFHKLLTPNVRTQLTNIHLIMVEMKKYKTNY
ncbi:vacuolar protein sorting-associated protein 52 homolog [Tribolium castaneum]|uniref:Vacuolar protein sorting-associated protein 52 homolog n=1 Tax=Tribolium castaneum TaxID=7070 RepID=D6WLS8_TRICA|nr:PREDICTED: vacuolar protein sorting-associated protein 52 homolog [Tribolium castaneum]EFA03408.1 Vacuolar protein sorting-associated protein 52 homolog-like Protein [Tribolium castaneum]|eukprot:XP_973597.1 PREDICTED: vacuolar protein sorting-associated protein 52 homolog [Tribolium castaneum]